MVNIKVNTFAETTARGYQYLSFHKILLEFFGERPVPNRSGILAAENFCAIDQQFCVSMFDTDQCQILDPICVSVVSLC
jgi:hypothetical protein